MANEKANILEAIRHLEFRLKGIDSEREHLSNELSRLRLTLAELQQSSLHPSQDVSCVDSQSPLNEKITLFRSLFKGREDVYPKLWVSKKTGAKGYSPVCENEWINGVCKKPVIKCGSCDNRKLSPLSDDVIRRHLDGAITLGTYPMRQDETCGSTRHWQNRYRYSYDSCKKNKLPCARA